jgi:hypothetical protein
MCPLPVESRSQSPNVAALLMASLIPPKYRAGSGARSRRHSLVSLIALGDLPIADRKIHEGFVTYKRNTGSPHPLSRSIQLSGRASGGDPLTDDNAQMWFGTISVGTPPKTFTGITFLYDDSKPLTDSRYDQWTLIPEAAISSCPRRNVIRAAQGTDCMTRGQVRLRTISLIRSHCLTEMDPLLRAINLLMLSALLA